MVSPWLLGWMRKLTDQNKYMKSILWAYANDKVTGQEEAQRAIDIIDSWGDSND